jgi:hypothetical protein
VPPVITDTRSSSSRTREIEMIVINEPGPACPRCDRLMRVGRPMQVREYGRICQKQLPYNVKRWFYCLNCQEQIWDDFN